MTNRKKLPDNWWDLGINPILGYKIPKQTQKFLYRKNSSEFHPDDDIKYWKNDERSSIKLLWS